MCKGLFCVLTLVTGIMQFHSTAFCREDDETDDVPAAKRKRDISNVPPLTAFFTSRNTSDSVDGVKNPVLPRHRFLKNCGLMRVQNLWLCWFCRLHPVTLAFCHILHLLFLLVPLLLAGSGAYNMGDWCLDVHCPQTFFKSLLLLQFLSNSYDSWHMHICAMNPYRKKLWNTCSKFLAIFSNFELLSQTTFHTFTRKTIHLISTICI